MILLGFTEGSVNDAAPERQVKVQLDWIGALREHEIVGTVLVLAHVGEVWVRESLPEVEAEMLKEWYRRQDAINRAAWNGKVNSRG